MNSHFTSVDQNTHIFQLGRKGSWNDFVTKYNDTQVREPSQANRTFQKKSTSNANFSRVAYRLQDYLPKRGARRPSKTMYADIEQASTEINQLIQYRHEEPQPKQITTARFAHTSDRQPQQTTSVVVETRQQQSSSDRKYLEQLASQAQKIKALEDLVVSLKLTQSSPNKIEKKPKALGWGPRMLIQVLPTRVQKDTQGIQTNATPQFATTYPTQNIATRCQTVQSNEISGGITGRMTQRTDRTRTLPTGTKLTKGPTNQGGKQNNQARSNQPTRQYRVRKQFMELYPVKYSEVDSIVRTLLSYDD